MKKIIITSLCFAILLSALCGCAAEDPLEVLSKSMEASKNLQSLDMTIDGNIKLSLYGSVFTIPVLIDIQEARGGHRGADAAIYMKFEFMGEAVDFKMYYTQGITYVNAMGTKYKQNMEIDATLIDSGNLFSAELLESAVTDIKMERFSGDRKLSFSIDIETLLNTLKENLRSMADAQNPLGEAVETFDTSFINAKESFLHYETIIGNDYIMQGTSVKAEVKLNIEGKEMTLKFDFTTKMNSVNDVVVEFPPDLDSYPDYDTPIYPDFELPA